MTRSLHVAVWLNTAEYPQRHGFTPSNAENMACLRIGPLVIAAEVVTA